MRARFLPGRRAKTRVCGGCPHAATNIPWTPFGFGHVPVHFGGWSKARLDLELDTETKTDDRVSLAKGRSNLGEAFTCPASSSHGCPAYMAGSERFNIVEYQVFAVVKSA